MLTERVTIEKLVFGGQGLGRIGNKVAFVWGALPGEEVIFQVTKKKKQFIEGVVETVVTPAPERCLPAEPHYLSCSPWQSMDFSAENKWKLTIAQETYQRLGGLSFPEMNIVNDENAYHYRNKIEYSFAGKDGEVVFAFHERGRYWASQVLDECALATKAINETAHQLLAWINAEKIPSAALKSLIVRSNTKGETIAALFVKETRRFVSHPKKSGVCRGVHIYYSNPLSPAAVPTESLFHDGDTFLTEVVNGVPLRYGLLSFFQVNVPVFEKAIAAIARHTERATTIVDYYAGVGSIGLAVAKKDQKLVVIENNAEAVMFAEENIELAKKENATAVLMAAEKETSHIAPTSTVIVDPPRAGLDKRMINAFLEVKPEKIIYLSCDLATQARDLKELVANYKPVFSELYNFFPRTPHIEGLVILERK